MDDFPCVNSILIERHLREQEARERDNDFLEAKQLWGCSCGQLFVDLDSAEECCGKTPFEVEGYICDYCEDVSTDFDEINDHDHDSY